MPSIEDVIGGIHSRKPIKSNETQSIELVTSSKGQFFVKHSKESSASFFCEAEGLERISSLSRIRVPDIVFASEDLLILEAIQEGSPTEETYGELAERLAEFHMAKGEEFGWERDNYIGLSPQVNSPSKDWIHFFAQSRLGVQLEWAENRGYLELCEGWRETLHHGVAEALKGVETFPSPLHGDLWAGNHLVDSEGVVALIDPAFYYGHWEAEIAMMKLFGGYPNQFYEAYLSRMNPPAGLDRRLRLYNIYHLLNHLNLFGRSYLGQVQSGLDEFFPKLDANS